MSDILILLLGALFFAVANPYTFEIVDKFVPVLDSNGPTPLGVLFHSIVFCIILVGVKKSNLLNKFN